MASQNTREKVASKAEKKKAKEEKLGAETFGKKGQHFMTMTRADYRAYEYLCRQAEAKEWIEAVLGRTLPDPDLYKSLADGTILCELINTMYPGSVEFYSKPNSFAWKLRENVQKFIQACKTNGKMNEYELFRVDDLFDKKNMPKFLESLETLADKAAKDGFKIKWVKKENRQFSAFEIQEAKKLEGVNLWKSESSKKLDLVEVTDI